MHSFLSFRASRDRKSLGIHLVKVPIEGHDGRTVVKLDHPQTEEFLEQLDLFPPEPEQERILIGEEFHADLASFRELGKVTTIIEFAEPNLDIPVYVNEFWTSKQRPGRVTPSTRYPTASASNHNFLAFLSNG